jgi:hypothetical protein
MKKAAALIISLLMFCTVSCADGDFESRIIVFKGDFPSKPYITALANENYYMDYSLFYDGIIISNKIATDGNSIESRSEVDGSISHTLFTDGSTYFLDDENKVYFRADLSQDEGLRSDIDYSVAKYITSGKETLLTGSEYNYDEFLCKTVYGEDVTVKLFTDEKGDFKAIIDSIGANSVERDVAEFSSDIPEGWLEIPQDFLLVDEDAYFSNYYGG